jgi:cold shock protein
MVPESDRLVNVEGVVKWFDPKKGFGFIVGPDGQDIFAHYTKIEGDGFRVLSDGAVVRYDAERGEKGWNATRVIRVSTAEEPVTATRRTYSRTPRR